MAGNPAWKKGVSANPKGRPKGGISMTKRLEMLLREKVETAMVDGRRKKVSQAELLMQTVIRMAIKGDKECIKWIWDRCDGPIETAAEINVNQRHEHGGSIALDWSKLGHILARPDDAPLELTERDGEFTREGAEPVREDPGDAEAGAGGA